MKNYSHTQNFIMPMNFVGVSSKEAMHTSGGPCWVHTDVVLEMGSRSDANMYTHKYTLNHILSTQCVQQSLLRGHEKQNTSKLSMNMIPREEEQGRATKQSKRSNTIVALARYNMTETKITPLHTRREKQKCSFFQFSQKQAFTL